MPRIEVFSGPDCRYCQAVKTLLEEHDLAFDEFDVKADSANLDEFKRRLPRVKTIPQIFIDGQHIGGFEDLGDYLERNERRP